MPEKKPSLDNRKLLLEPYLVNAFLYLHLYSDATVTVDILFTVVYVSVDCMVALLEINVIIFQTDVFN